MIGTNEPDDQYNGFFMPIQKQLDMACDIIKNDTKLASGFHAVGFSQGGLFLRGLVQTCEEAHVMNLISIGGPQQVRLPLRV
jgi:palmitoyl-protein thioesterase